MKFGVLGNKNTILGGPKLQKRSITISGAPRGCGVRLRLCHRDVNQFTSFEGFDSEYVKLHSGGPGKVSKGVASSTSEPFDFSSASRRRDIQNLRRVTP